MILRLQRTYIEWCPLSGLRHLPPGASNESFEQIDFWGRTTDEGTVLMHRARM